MYVLPLVGNQAATLMGSTWMVRDGEHLRGLKDKEEVM
jgi:hypothetical protein